MSDPGHIFVPFLLIADCERCHIRPFTFHGWRVSTSSANLRMSRM